MKRLGVWLRGERVGRLDASGPGRVTFTYDSQALVRFDLNIPLLSCSLPVRTGRQNAWAFTTGLLPEGQHRDAMARIAGVTTSDLLGMLDRFGRDVAGAVVIAADGPAKHAGRIDPYTADSLAAAVDSLPDHPLGLDEESELSVAGVQDKMLLVELPDGQWGRPVHGAPSTHILKVDDPRFPGLVRAEHACLTIAAAAGVPAAASSLVTVGNRECIVVRRFDRVVADGGETERLHQEDSCQALGIDPEKNQRRAKYEKYGGPSFVDVAGLLDAWAMSPEEQLLALLDRAVITVVIGDADAHGKNIGLLHPTDTSISLSPMYDTVPTVIWPNLRRDAAMSVNGKFDLERIAIEDLVAEAASWGLSESVARRRTVRLIERVLSVIEDGKIDVDSPALESTATRAKALLG